MNYKYNKTPLKLNLKQNKIKLINFFCKNQMKGRTNIKQKKGVKPDQ